MDPSLSTEMPGGAGASLTMPPPPAPPAAPPRQPAGGQPRHGVKYRAYTEDDMRRAAQAIMEGMSLRKASVAFHVPKTTLAERMGDKRPKITPKKDADGGSGGTNNNNNGDDDDGINGNHDGDGTASKRNFTRYTWTEAEMAQAERAVQGGESVRAAARRFGVPPSSLNSRTRGREPRDLKGDVSRLTLKQESLLAEWASAQARLGFPPAKDDVFDLAERVLRRSAPDGRTKLGKQWIGHWLRRWPHVEVLDWKAKQAGETRRRGLDLFDDSHSAVIQSEGQQQQQQQQQQPQQLEQQSTAEG